MISFVNDARGKAYVAEARVGMAAAQAVVTELRASGTASSISSAGVITSTVTTLNNANILDQTTFLNMTGDVENAGATRNGFSAVTVTADRVTGIVYTTKNSGHVITIADGMTTVTKTP
jgi:hypothetical protein